MVHELWTLTLKEYDIGGIKQSLPWNGSFDVYWNWWISESNKGFSEDQQGNNHHQQQNRRQETTKIYVASPAEGRGYAGNLAWCNRCKAHHQTDKQCAEIEKKNLLIENENLIVNCLSTQLLYDVEKSRCLDLEADMSKVHDESKLISKLEREYLNLQLKYQHLQESFDNKNSQASQEAPDFNSFFKIKNLEHQIKEKDNVIRHLKDLVASVNDRSREPYNAVDVTALIKQNDCDRVELEKVKQHYKELYDSIKIARAHTSEKTSTMLNEIESLKAQLRSKEPCFTSDYVKPKVLTPGMYAIDVKPIPHPLKNNRSALIPIVVYPIS
ncbi:hypothetical protein Tco_1203548 [Tanacetum coccineum]